MLRNKPADSPVWHPFTQHALQGEVPLVTRGEGAWLHTRDGKRILDGISSWWVVTHGHCHPHIVAAIQGQAQQLDQVIFAGHTHEPAEELARRLVQVAPGQSRVFFSDSGSTAVEVALKMALGYWKHSTTGKAKARSRIIALEHAYHGDTIGTMSAGERGVFNAAYEPMLFDVARIPAPLAGQEQACLDALEAAARDPAAAALIVEPLVLGAGGMLMYSPEMLRNMKAVCERHGVLFIADEVMTGWGRTSTLFACEQAGVVPDILCTAKGITGGSLPLAATLCREPIFQAHYSTDRRKTFFHSSSYTANPIACAAAVANLEVWEREPVRERLATIANHHSRRLEMLRNNARFGALRQSGTIAAMDLQVRDAGYLSDIGPRLYRQFAERGILLRPLGNTIYILPPYCITGAELDLVYDAITEVAQALPD